MDTQWRSEWVNVCAAACSLESWFGFQGIVKWGIGGVSVGDISEWWLWGCGAALEDWWSMCSRRSWVQEDGNIRPACSTRMSIGGGVWMCDFLCCTFVQLWWVFKDSFLCPLVLFIHLVSRGSVWNCWLLFSSQDECWSPGAASGGGQLHQAGEEYRASMAGIDCQEEYREINMVMWNLDFISENFNLICHASGWFWIAPVSQMKFLASSWMCNFSILCRKRVAVGWGLQQDSHSLGKRVASSAGPGDGQMQERQEELP